MFRQGDVLIYPTTEMPNGLKPIKPRGGRLILAEGEATGHHHSVDACTAELFEAPGGGLLLNVKDKTAVTHQEHGAINIAPGMYWVVRQREYDAGEVRKVRD